MIESFLNDLSSRLDAMDAAAWLAPLWKGALVLAGAWIATALLRRRAAALRHLLWLAALVGVALIPPLTLVMPRAELAVLPAEAAVAPAAQPELREDFLAVGSFGLSTFSAPSSDASTDKPLPPKSLEPDSSVEETSSATSTSEPLSLGSWILLVWAAGASLVLAHALLGLVASRRLLKRARPIELEVDVAELAARLGLRRPVAVLTSEAVATPMACGLLHSRILLPTEAAEWPSERLRAVLLHELAHLARRDCPSQLLAELCLALRWFDPLAWFAMRRLTAERERACDDRVLRAGTAAEDYADCLIDVARGRGTSGPRPLLAVPMARGSQLEGRLLAILDERRRRGPTSRRAKATALAGVATATLTLACLDLTSRPALGLEFVGGETIVQERQPAGIDLHVALVRPGEGPSIQEAIDAAPAGGTIHVAAGEYGESLVVTKALTLIGEGAQTTRVRSPEAGKSALEVLGAGRVVVRGLRFSATGEHEGGKLRPSAIVRLAGNARLMDCTVIEGPANGIVVAAGAEVELVDCRVAAVWAEGVVVEKGASARIEGCEVRNAYHYGILIRSDAAHVEDCRVSRTGWHGVRYDHCSPTVRGNLLHDNDRFGIYLNGATGGTIQGNHLHGNGYAGIVTWGSGTDRIEGNTFSKNGRSGLEILEESGPILRRNLFVSNGRGVGNGNVSEDSPFVAKQGEVVFEENVFWENGEDTRWVANRAILGEAEAGAFFARGRNRVLDPRFAGAEEGDYRLEADSPARIAGVGVADPPPIESPWPIQPEELRFLEAKDPEPEPPATAAISEQKDFQRWIEGALQIDDPQLRAASLDSIRQALASGDPAMRLEGLVAFLGSLDAIEDKASFRDLVLLSIDAEDAWLQRNAFYALYNTGVQPEDLERVLAAARAKKPGLQSSITHLVTLYSDGVLRGESSRVLEELFATDDKRVLNDLLGGIWGAELSEALEARLIEISHTDDRDLRHNAIYFGLSTLKNKSRAVIEELMKAAQGRDSSDAGRALWGLGHGVTPENASLVADFGLRLFASRTSSRTRSKCLRLIENYAGAAQLLEVEALAANELVDAESREELRKVAERIRAADR